MLCKDEHSQYRLVWMVHKKEIYAEQENRYGQNS